MSGRMWVVFSSETREVSALFQRLSDALKWCDYSAPIPSAVRRVSLSELVAGKDIQTMPTES